MKVALLMNRFQKPAVAGQTVAHHGAIIVQPRDFCGHLMAAFAVQSIEHRSFGDEHMQP